MLLTDMKSNLKNKDVRSDIIFSWQEWDLVFVNLDRIQATLPNGAHNEGNKENLCIILAGLRHQKWIVDKLLGYCSSNKASNIYEDI